MAEGERSRAIGKSRGLLEWSDRLAIGQCVLLSIGLALLVLTVPIFMLQLYDRVLPSGSVDTLLVLTAIALLLLAAYGVLHDLRSRLMGRTGVVVELRLLEELKPTEPVMRDLDRMRQAVRSGALTGLLDLPALPIFLVFLAILQPWLAIVAVLGAAALALASLSAGWGVGRQQQAPEPVEAILDGRQGHFLAPLQAVALERRTFRQIRAREADVGWVDRRSRCQALLKALRLATQIACLAVGGYLAIKGQLQPSAIIAGTILMSRVLAPVEQLCSGWQTLREGWFAWGRLRQVRAGAELGGGFMPMAEPLPREPTIELKEAVVGPPGGSRAVLRGLDLRVTAGTVLGICGASASGKSLLLQTLAGQVPARLGQVRVCEQDPHRLDAEDHRRVIGYMPQDPWLIEGSIAENIAGFRNRPTPRAILDAARRAGIHQAILSEPEGYGTAVGAGGRHLSFGLRRGVALAAALYDDPPVLLLDALYDGLDNPWRQRLASVVANIAGRRRIVVVTAHRLEDLSGTTHIAIIGDGRIQLGGRRQDTLAALRAKRSVKALGDNRAQHASGRPANGARPANGKASNGTRATNGKAAANLAANAPIGHQARTVMRPRIIEPAQRRQA